MTMATKQRKIPAPPVSPETQPFWDAARDGRLVVPKCRPCGKVHWYPRAICPFCQSSEVEWMQASGTGTIYSFSVMRRAPEPFAVAYVTLAEGPTMITNLVDCDFDKLKIGQQVRIKFTPTDGGPPVPTFTPVG
jgi:uncharacterized OB-fold protein